MRKRREEEYHDRVTRERESGRKLYRETRRKRGEEWEAIKVDREKQNEEWLKLEYEWMRCSTKGAVQNQPQSTQSLH